MLSDRPEAQVLLWYSAQDNKFHVEFAYEGPPVSGHSLPPMTPVQLAVVEIAGELNSNPEYVTMLADRYISRLGRGQDDAGRAN